MNVIIQTIPISLNDLTKKLEKERQEIEFHSILKTYDNEICLHNLISGEPAKKIGKKAEKTQSNIKSKISVDKEGFIVIKEGNIQPDLPAIRKVVVYEIEKILKGMTDECIKEKKGSLSTRTKRKPEPIQEMRKSTRKIKNM